MFTRHVRACKGNIVNTIQESWKQENGKYRCPYCKTEKTKAGIGSHIWHKHTEKGRVFKPTKGSKRVVSDLTRANISKSLRGHSVSKKTRDSLSVRMKEKNPAKSLNVRQKLSKVAIRSNAERLENGTHNLLRDRNNAKNFFFERLFDKILYTENFVTDAIRVCSIAMKVVRDYDENLQEIYRDKVAFEFDWLNEKLGN
jgi:ribosomal protein L37AE/L43A